MPNKRMGIVRYGLNGNDHAVSPNGIYFTHDSFIYYADNGLDTFIKLCGRADCTHNSEDCNAYVKGAASLSFYRGYLYVMSGNRSEKKTVLVRMEPDGSDHVEVLDMLAFAKETGGEFAACYMNTDGYCLIDTYRWETTSQGKDHTAMASKNIGTYLYKLDGSMDEPVEDKCFGVIYHCGDTLRAMSNETRNGGEYGSIWAADLETGTMTYLLDHPGITGDYDNQAGHYCNEGNIIRLDYGTMEEEILVETELEGRYLLFMFPDCMMLASRADNNPDPNLYIYNWNYELVDTVKLSYAFDGRTQFMLFAETAERFILTDTMEYGAMPKYYINKAELGTGNVQIHEFKYS